MSARFVWDGLAELKAELRKLPAELTAEAVDLVFANAEAAAQEIRAAYPARTGNLKNHLTVKRSRGQFSTSAQVRSTAKHAYLFEVGSQARHTDLGANRGSMPAGHVFIPIVMRQRRIMYERLAQVLTNHGLTVTSNA